MTYLIPEDVRAAIRYHAEICYPEECCGFVAGPKDTAILTKALPCKNVQNEYHQKDPEQFPRNAETAYFMDPAEQLHIQKQLRSEEAEIKIIYHSHIEAEPYFSNEDMRLAVDDGQPLYPGILYLIVSV